MSTREITLLTAMTKVGKKLKGSKMLKSNLRGTKIYLDKIMNQLELDETESLLFIATFIIQMQEESMDLRDFTRFLDINSLDVIQYKQSFDKLVKMKYVTSNSRSGAHLTTFISGRRNLKIYEPILEAILENKPVNEVRHKKMDVYEFMHEISELIEDRSHNDYYTDELFDQVRDIENENQHLKFIHELHKLNLNVAERTFLYEMADDFARAGFTALNITLKDIYRNVKERMTKSREIIEERSMLSMLGMISIQEGLFHDDTKLELTEKSQQFFFGDDARLFQKRQSSPNLLKVENIERKELFFEAKTKEQLDMLTSSLEQDNFNHLQARLKENQMPSGVAAIFYGSPGTGKSESAYQLARITGRDIISVDLSDTKSMWFGQSEKKIKEIFTEYNKACQRSEIKPILLFNEADGVLSRRSDNNHKSATHQTENTIQNILLEQFEKNQGIIIATTNLEKNLDSAFERRFLFKVKFGKPTPDIRKQIWLNKMNWITEEVLEQIVDRFEFSGGEIDNIFRKMVMHQVTSGAEYDSELLLKFCESERFENQSNGKKLGYY